jgi:hypothetical protein
MGYSDIYVPVGTKFTRRDKPTNARRQPVPLIVDRHSYCINRLLTALRAPPQ